MTSFSCVPISVVVLPDVVHQGFTSLGFIPGSSDIWFITVCSCQGHTHIHMYLKSFSCQVCYYSCMHIMLLDCFVVFCYRLHGNQLISVNIVCTFWWKQNLIIQLKYLRGSVFFWNVCRLFPTMILSDCKLCSAGSLYFVSLQRWVCQCVTNSSRCVTVLNKSYADVDKNKKWNERHII